ncbi:MAG: glycosyltransferase involved in cell wall biosynthesis [Cryomorphaceae bacterium]|jgi:glycosyltransferase involved in cell wall biosynthesis
MKTSTAPLAKTPSRNTVPSGPLVSVVIPVYGVEKYIQEAVASVLAQTYVSFEVIIVDDESPDNSIEIVQHSFSDNRIRIVRQANRGLAGARNTGIRHAKGEFVAFLDSDDFWVPEKLENHVALMLCVPGCGVSFSSSQFVNEQSQALGRMQAPKKKQDYEPQDIFCRNPIGNGSVPVIRKSILEQVAFFRPDKLSEGEPYAQYFDETLRQSEDVDCWTRIALKTATEFHYIDKPLTHYRLYNGGLSADVDKQFATWMTLLTNLEAYAPDFANKYGSTAKAYQYRYLARRSVFQGQARNALRFMILAFGTNPRAMFVEVRKTAETVIASIVLSLFPRRMQIGLVERLTRP